MSIEVGADLRTIGKWIEDPESVSRVTRYALDAAAERLGYAPVVTKKRKAS